MDMLFNNKTVLVTGGTSGIGKAIALLFAQKGANVAIFGTDETRARETVEELDSTKIHSEQTFKYFLPHIADKDAVSKAIECILIDWGNLDILVNNAGITRDALLIRMTEQAWDDVIAVNLKSIYNTCRVLVRPMMKVHHGKIINISSVVARTGNIGQTNYCASKAGIIGLTKSLALELARWNICVNCVCPGYIRTRMTETLSDRHEDELLAKIPLGRIGAPADVARLVLFLASDWADYITGQTYSVDGGMTMT